MSALHLRPQATLGHADVQGAGLIAGARQALSRLALALAHPLAALAVPRRRSAYEEAHNVRELALEWQRTDPRCAAELLAAADRHELLHG